MEILIAVIIVLLICSFLFRNNKKSEDITPQNSVNNSENNNYTQHEIPQGPANFSGNNKIILAGTGENKIAVIKEIRDFTKADLVTAKEMAENTPTIIIDNVNDEYAQVIKNNFEKAGAIINIEKVEQ